jgi:hypothetical protein
MPVLLMFGGWQLAIWAYEYFGCQGNLKNLEPCFVGSFNLLPWLGIGLFWCHLLLWVFVPISTVLVLNIAWQQYREKHASNAT